MQLLFRLIIFLIVNIYVLKIHAQASVDGFLYVYPNAPEAYPSSGNLTGSSALNAIFSQHQVNRYHKSFPGAPSNSFIDNAYEIHLDGDIHLLYNDLTNSGLFDLIEAEEYYSTNAILPPPAEAKEMLDNTFASCQMVNDPFPFTPDENPNFDSRWVIDDLELECAWEITKGDPAIVIGIVDTEFDNDHPELVGKTLPDFESEPWYEQFTIDQECFHGTAVSGYAGAQPNNGLFIAGSGYNTSLAGYVVPTQKRTWIDANGIERSSCRDTLGHLGRMLFQAGVLDNHPIVNMSWSGTGSVNNDPIFGNITRVALARTVVESGTLLVVAAGNWDNGNPANHDRELHIGVNEIPGVVVVSTIGINGQHQHSNGRHYPEVDLCAPGRTLNGINFDDTGSYIGTGGASISAPFVSGIAALCLDVNPCLTPPELEAILKGTTDTIVDEFQFPNAQGNDFSGLVGTGYVNAYQAVLAASEKLSNHTITTDETWNYPRRIEGTLTIQAGAKLTLTSTIACAFDSKIVVEVGAELIIDGGWLRRDCDNDKNWKGIEVLGNPSVNQFSSGAQGKVALNNAIIEHAETGVSLFRRQTYAQGGGILLADNSTFLNCQNGVAFAKYTNTFPTNGNPVANLSRIERCVFTLDDDFSFDQGGEHIQLDRVTRINIHNSILQDERTSYTQANDLQDGIWSSNATFWLTGDSITNMRYGIKAENIKSGRTFRVDDNVFTDNFFGMSVRAVDNFEFTDNDISVGGFSGPTTEFTFPNRQTGLHVDQSSGFFIEDNDFVAVATLPTGAEPVGLAVNNTNVGTAGDLNSDENTVFRNTFADLYRANVANGENGGENFAGGLLYICNQNTTNICTDFTVFDGSIAAVQISDNGNATGNTFTQDDSCNPFSDFDNSNGNIITYHYYDGSSGNIEEPLFVSTIDFEKLIQTENLCTNNDGSTGPLPPGGDGTIISQFPTVRQNYLNLRSQYTSQLDGGDTDYVLSVISGMGSGSFSVYQQLQQLSPWLSSEVLLAFTDHATPSATEKENLLSANPDGIKGSALNNSIANGGWFTSQQIANIQTAAQGTTTRTQLEDNLRTAQAELQDITQALENYYQIDEADSGTDYANQATWAANGESLDGYLRSIDNRLWAADITTAQNEIATLQALDMSTQQTQEVSYFVQLKNLEIDLLNSSRGYDEATTTEIGDLQTIATQSAGRAGIQAQNWLHLLSVSEAQNEAYWGSSSATLMGQEQVPGAPAAVATIPEYLHVHPNPSTGIFRFQYQPSTETVEGTVRIYNLGGQIVHQQVVAPGNHFSWQPLGNEAGFYFFVLEGQNGILLQQGKLVYMPE